MTDKDTDKNGGQSQVILETRARTKKPSMYKVIMLNDDYTPMEFVVYVLQRFFGMSNSQATAIMLNVHQRGVGLVLEGHLPRRRLKTPPKPTSTPMRKPTVSITSKPMSPIGQQ